MLTPGQVGLAMLLGIGVTGAPAMLLGASSESADLRSVILGIVAVAAAAAPGLVVARHGMKAGSSLARTAALLVAGSGVRTVGAACIGVAVLLAKQPEPAAFFLTIVAVGWGALVAETWLVARRFWDPRLLAVGGIA